MLEQILHVKRMRTPMDEAFFRPGQRIRDDYQFFQINKLSLSDELEPAEIQLYIYERIKEFVASLSNAQSPIIFRLKSERQTRKITLSIGAVKRSGTSISERFGAYFQTSDMKEIDDRLEPVGYEAQVVITGITGRNETKFFEYIEPFVRTARDKDALLEIVAKPLTKTAILHQLDTVIGMRTGNSIALTESSSQSLAKSETYSTTLGQTSTDGSNSGGGLVVVSGGRSTSEGITSSDSDTKGTTETVTKNSEKTDFQAMELDSLLENYIERLQQALSSGLWQTAISIFSRNRSELVQIGEVYQSTYSANAVEPYRQFDLNGVYPTVGLLEEKRASHSINIFHEHYRLFSFLTGEELAYVLDVPKHDYNGYELSQCPRFNQNPPNHAGAPLGYLYDAEKKTDTLLHLEQDQLVKHMLVAGITGSGKTNTIFHVLSTTNVPFLIIEPAKKEYRGLSRKIPELRVYTLGNEAVSPFRINPFYFPVNVNIQQHIDNLKVIFNASFTMYASMPNILEQCIMNVYIKKGWSLTTSRNIYQQDEQQYEWYFPTIGDLYDEIDSYTKELGYAQEQMQNIRAALLTRIRSLMVGGKGYMLNTVETIDIGELLARPTVLELEAIADDDEKSLVIGLISVFIYEYVRSQELGFTGVLKHLLVFEEAHRIFANVSQQGSQESVNIKGKAVESLSHILSEIRAYGEGMIIVDQVPTKLAPDVLKNTNTKIIHRIVSKDDCEYVANSLGLTEEKVHFISKLTNGAALMFTDGMSSPAHLQLIHGKEDVRYIPDEEVRLYSQSYNHLLYNAKHMHPVTEILMQNLSAYEDLSNEVKRFYRSLLEEPLRNVQSQYAAVKSNLIRYAANYGFDMNMDVDSFVASFVKEVLLALVKMDATIKKQVNRRIMLERYIEACLELVDKQADVHKKEYALMENMQLKLGGIRYA